MNRGTIISMGSLFFVIAQFVVLKGEVEMTGKGRRSFERIRLGKLRASWLSFIRDLDSIFIPIFVI